LTSFSYDQQLSSGLELGGEIMDVSGDDDVRDHTSVLLAGRYARPDNSLQHAAHLLADDDGNVALWLDSRHEFRRLPTLRYGAFHFDSDIVWADWPIASGQSGVYARADGGNSRINFSTGYDYMQTETSAVSISATDTHSVFVTGNLRLRRAFNLGTSASLASREIVASVVDDQRIARLNVFAGLRTPLGGARFDVFSYEVNSDLAVNRRERSGASVGFNWRMPERIRLTTELRGETDKDNRGSKHRTELSALFRYDLFDDLTLGVRSGLYSSHGENYSEDDGLSLTADARWRFSPNWVASLSINRNRAVFEIDDLELYGRNGSAGHSSIWFALRYEERSGQPYPMFGRTEDGMSGAGAITGQVYFDLNRDSRRQPSEEVAVGAVVVLDGRYETRTDEQGRFVFTPVPTGAHEIMVLTEELPLPWGLDDETPRRVIARFRQTETVDFPLIVME